VNWGWLLLRIAIGLAVLTTLFLSQRFWYRTIWHVTSNWSAVWLRVVARLLVGAHQGDFLADVFVQ